MKVLFVLPRMVCGGIERVTLTLASGFMDRGISCTLALRHRKGEFLEEADSLLTVHELARDGLHHFIPSLTKLIKQLEPTHVITAFNDIAALTFVALKLAKSEARLIHGAHNVHHIATATPGIIGSVKFKIDKIIARFIYNQAYSVVAVSRGVKDEIVKEFYISDKKITVIYNPVLLVDTSPDSKPKHNNSSLPIRLLALGRLVPSKGFDILIEAASLLTTKIPWILDIYGDGPERRHLAELIDELGLASEVVLRGHTNEPYEPMRGADVFILPSRHEGLGIVLIEAMICGNQLIATDCPHGPKEILLNGVLGQIVPAGSAVDLANAIAAVIEDRFWVDPRKMLERANDFSPETAITSWFDLLTRKQ
jgi:glycosyltransferase involved in cell wall biosynthesis